MGEPCLGFLNGELIVSAKQSRKPVREEILLLTGCGRCGIIEAPCWKTSLACVGGIGTAQMEAREQKVPMCISPDRNVPVHRTTPEHDIISPVSGRTDPCVPINELKRKQGPTKLHTMD